MLYPTVAAVGCCLSSIHHSSGMLLATQVGCCNEGVDGDSRATAAFPVHNHGHLSMNMPLTEPAGDRLGSGVVQERQMDSDI
jgi:hypothetical protein